MKVSPIKSFNDSKYGRMTKNLVREVDDATARRWILLGHVNPAGPNEYETKVVQQTPVAGPKENPTLAAGKEQPSVSSPAAQASQSQTVNTSESGKKRGRPAKSESYQ